VFICPKETADCFKFLRGLVATDGAHLKGVFVRTLLVAVRIDINNHIVPLARAVVESETESPMHWFLRELATAIPKLNTETTTLISDRGKGLQSADNELQHVVERTAFNI